MHYLKSMLDDVIDTAFANDPKLTLYKKYYLCEIRDNEYVTKRCGSYNQITREVSLFNLRKSRDAALKICIHEISHRIDVCNRGETRHDSEFLWYYCELLYAAFNMGILNKDDYVSCGAENPDWDMVRIMVQSYVPAPVSYEQKVYTVSAIGGDEKAEALQKRGYEYSADIQRWYKNVKFTEIDEEAYFLDSIGCGADITENIMQPYKIIAGKNTFSVKEQLREQGFRYVSGSKSWLLVCKNAKEADSRLKNLRTMFPNLSLTAAAL